MSQIFQEEPAREQDKRFAATLEPLDIADGENFHPNERQTKILLRGAAMGELMWRNM